MGICISTKVIPDEQDLYMIWKDNNTDILKNRCVAIYSLNAYLFIKEQVKNKMNRLHQDGSLEKHINFQDIDFSFILRTENLTYTTEKYVTKKIMMDGAVKFCKENKYTLKYLGFQIFGEMIQISWDK